MEKTVNYQIIKQKIIKTDEILQMYLDTNSKLKKLQPVYKQLKVKYEQTKTEADQLKLESERYTFNIFNSKTKLEAFEAENIKLKEQVASLENKFCTQLHDYQLDYKNLDNELSYCKKKLQDFENAKETPSPKKIKNRNLEYENKIKELQEECTRLNSQLRALDIENKKKIAHLILENRKTTDLLNITKVQHNQEVEKLNAENKRLQEELKQMNIQVEKLNNEIFRSHNQHKVEQTELESFSKEQEEVLLEDLKENTSKINELQDIISKLEDDIKLTANQSVDEPSLKNNRDKLCDVQVQTEPFDVVESEDECLVDNCIKEMTRLPLLMSPFSEISDVPHEGETVVEKVQNVSVPKIVVIPATPIETTIENFNFNKVNDKQKSQKNIAINKSETIEDEESSEQKHDSDYNDDHDVEPIPINNKQQVETNQKVESNNVIESQSRKYEFIKPSSRKFRKPLINSKQTLFKKKPRLLMHRKYQHDHVLNTLIALKKSNINFTISNNSIPYNHTYLKNSIFLPKSTNIPFASGIYPNVSNNKSTHVLSCKLKSCDETAYMVLSHEGEDADLMGFVTIKNEICTPSISPVQNVINCKLNQQTSETNTLETLEKLISSEDVINKLADLIGEKIKQKNPTLERKRKLDSSRINRSVASDSFYSETEPEIENLFKRTKKNVLKRNKMLLNKAKQQQNSFIRSPAKSSLENDLNLTTSNSELNSSRSTVISQNTDSVVTSVIESPSVLRTESSSSDYSSSTLYNKTKISPPDINDELSNTSYSNFTKKIIKEISTPKSIKKDFPDLISPLQSDSKSTIISVQSTKNDLSKINSVTKKIFDSDNSVFDSSNENESLFSSTVDLMLTDEQSQPLLDSASFKEIYKNIVTAASEIEKTESGHMKNELETKTVSNLSSKEIIVPESNILSVSLNSAAAQESEEDIKKNILIDTNLKTSKNNMKRNCKPVKEATRRSKRQSTIMKTGHFSNKKLTKVIPEPKSTSDKDFLMNSLQSNITPFECTPTLEVKKVERYHLLSADKSEDEKNCPLRRNKLCETVEVGKRKSISPMSIKIETPNKDLLITKEQLGLIYNTEKAKKKNLCVVKNKKEQRDLETTRHDMTITKIDLDELSKNDINLNQSSSITLPSETKTSLKDANTVYEDLIGGISHLQESRDHLNKNDVSPKKFIKKKLDNCDINPSENKKCDIVGNLQLENKVKESDNVNSHDNAKISLITCVNIETDNKLSTQSDTESIESIYENHKSVDSGYSGSVSDTSDPIPGDNKKIKIIQNIVLPSKIRRPLSNNIKKQILSNTNMAQLDINNTTSIKTSNHECTDLYMSAAKKRRIAHSKKEKNICGNQTSFVQNSSSRVQTNKKEQTVSFKEPANVLQHIQQPKKLIIPVVIPSSPDQGPKSPEPDMNIAITDTPPKIIPLEKPRVIDGCKAKSLFNKLINYSREEKALDEVIMEFLGQDVDYVAELVLERISQDRFEVAEKKDSLAPLLTETQKVFLGFMLRLEKNHMENVCNRYLEKAELRLFSLHEEGAVIPITRLYLAICKMRKDIYRMRRLCSDAFYFMGDLAVPLFFTVLTSWSEVMPMAENVKEFPLAKVLVQLVYLKENANIIHYRTVVRDLLHKFYGYPMERWNSDEMFKELVEQYLRNLVRSTDYTLLLFCKNHPKKWVMKRIDEVFKPIIEKVSIENFKATVIILVSNLCSQLQLDCEDDNNYINNIRKWLINVLKESESDVVRRSVELGLHRISRKRFKAKKPIVVAASCK